MSAGGGKSESSSQNATFIDPTQAPFLQNLYQQGTTLANQQLGPGSQFNANILEPTQQAFRDALTPGPNPFLQGQIQSGQNLITENLQQNILPSVGSAAAGLGQRGGGRQGVAEGIALRDANRQSSDFAQNLLAQDYQAQQQRMIQALTQAQNIGGLAFSPLQNLRDILGPANVLGQGTSSSESKSGSLGF